MNPGSEEDLVFRIRRALLSSRIRKWANIVCDCEVFETGFSTVEKLLTSLFRESLLISRAQISAGTPT
jgi:hypothetical protein